MNRFPVIQNWFTDLVPDGIVYPSSTIISGTAGSGKPIISIMLAASWLRFGEI
jgi:KaiC/GvpD/RAD55 family RecA-like ATPase